MVDVNVIKGQTRGRGKYLLLYADDACVFRIVDSTWPSGVYSVPVYLQIDGLGNKLTITHDFDGVYFQTVSQTQDGSDGVPFYGAVSGQQQAIYITYPPGIVIAGACTDTLDNILTRSSVPDSGHGPTDPYFANTVLLLGFNGANGATGAPGMTDESFAAHGTPTVPGGGIVGAAQISTARFVFGGSSLLLDGTSAFVGLGDHSDWNLSNQRFTLECRIYATSVAAPHHFIIGQWGAAGVLGWQLWHNGASLQFMCSDDGTTNRTLATTTIAANTWYAVAVDFDGTKYRMYLDGVMVNSSTTLYTFRDSGVDLLIGANANPGARLYFAGNVDELRLTKGVARYASDVGYTVATAAFPRS